MEINVRRATHDDLDWVVRELKSFASFYGTKLSLFPNIEHARTVMKLFVDEHVMFIAEERERGLMGFIAGWCTPHVYNPEIRLLSETFWWVAEEFRGTSAGSRLLNEFTEWGENNADWISFSLEHNSPVSEKSLFRRGYHVQERSFLKECV